MTSEEVAEKLEISVVIKNYNVHFKLLIRRYERFKQINDLDNL